MEKIPSRVIILIEHPKNRRQNESFEKSYPEFWCILFVNPSSPI